MSAENVTDLLNNIYLGEVARVQNYGAFVKLPGTKHQGLVHRSQVSSANVDDVTEVLRQGDRIWCKVIGITDDGKVSLSMKVVDQGSGKDLDPNGVQVFQDEQKRKARPQGYQKKAIELGAVFNTNCSKCGTRGHLSKDCFQSPDGKTYELIPEDDDTPEVPLVVENVKAEVDKKSKSHKKHKKDKKSSKKSKKKKKKYSSSESSSSSDSESSSEEERSRRHIKKKKTKSKNRDRSRTPVKKKSKR